MAKRWWEFALEALAAALAERKNPGIKAKAAMITSTGYTAPQPPSGVEESRSMSDCHELLQKRYSALKKDFELKTGRQLFETCTWRSKAKQAKLYASGRTSPGPILTQIDGVSRRSRHNVYPSEAVDVCVDIDPGPGKHPVWDAASYEPLRELAVKHKLNWGGAWKNFKDLPHLELPPEDCA